jgi:two-component system nitrogen regulation sensor histidine kinase GlnL
MNPSAENLFSMGVSGARGRPLEHVFPGADALAGMLRRAAEYEQTYAMEVVVEHLNGADGVHLDCRASPYPDGDDGDMLLEITDVTSRARISRDNALISQHDIGRKIVRQLAHEIKNPLGGLRGAAQLLRRQLDDPSLTEYTDVIIGEADRLAALVDSMLGPGGTIDKQQVNIHDVLEHVARLVSVGAGQDTIRLHRDYDPSLPNLLLDRDQMIQAILNVVVNAIAAAGEDGNVTLRTRAITNYTIGDIRHRVIASIEIEDDGPGVAPEIADSIFYPLVTGRPDGTGIGLPLSQELINRHGGLIEFTSRPGQTIFQIRLPI